MVRKLIGHVKDKDSKIMRRLLVLLWYLKIDAPRKMWWCVNDTEEIWDVYWED